MTRPVSRARVAQELARARGARRLLPWAALSALGAGAIALVAGGGARGAAVLFAAGLLFALFLWVTSIPRCPVCGTRLAVPRGGEAPASCGRCRSRFE